MFVKVCVVMGLLRGGGIHLFMMQCVIGRVPFELVCPLPTEYAMWFKLVTLWGINLVREHTR